MQRAWIDRDALSRRIYEKANGESFRKTAAKIDGISTSTLHRATTGGSISLDALLILIGWLECDVSAIVKNPVRQYELF